MSSPYTIFLKPPHASRIRWGVGIGGCAALLVVIYAASGNAGSLDTAIGTTTVAELYQGAVYAYLDDKPIYASEIAERINGLSDADRRQLTSVSGSLKAFVDTILVDKLIVSEAAGLNLESTDTYARKMRAASEKIQRDLYVEMLIGRVAPPTETELGVYYRRHLTEYTRPAAVQMMYVLVGDLETANRVYREAKGGAVFHALQATWSITSDSITTLGVDNLPVEMHEQFATLAGDGIFMPYATTKGVYIFKQIASSPLQIMSLDEVRDTVRQAAHLEKVQAFLAAFREALTRDHSVRIVGSITQNAAPTPGGQ